MLHHCEFQFLLQLKDNNGTVTETETEIGMDSSVSVGRNRDANSTDNSAESFSSRVTIAEVFGNSNLVELIVRYL